MHFTTRHVHDVAAVVGISTAEPEGVRDRQQSARDVEVSALVLRRAHAGSVERAPADIQRPDGHVVSVADGGDLVHALVQDEGIGRDIGHRRGSGIPRSGVVERRRVAVRIRPEPRVCSGRKRKRSD